VAHAKPAALKLGRHVPKKAGSRELSPIRPSIAMRRRLGGWQQACNIAEIPAEAWV
jgi:hypothetical protein